MALIDGKASDEFLQLLLVLRQEMQQLLADSAEGAKPVQLDAPIGRLSRMDALQQQSMVQANRRVAQMRLARVEAALRRHAAGEYGQCLDCDEMISLARLKASPEATLCVACQEERESRDRKP